MASGIISFYWLIIPKRNHFLIQKHFYPNDFLVTQLVNKKLIIPSHPISKDNILSCLKQSKANTFIPKNLKYFMVSFMTNTTFLQYRLLYLVIKFLNAYCQRKGLTHILV